MTVDSQWALQQAVYALLAGDATLQTWLGDPARVFDHVPSEASLPYVVIGSIMGTPFDSKTSQGMTHSLSLHVWDGDDGASPGYRGAGRLRQVMARVVDLLDRADLGLSGHTLVMIAYEGSQTLTDASGLRREGTLSFRALVQSA